MDSFTSYIFRQAYEKVSRLGDRLAKIDKQIDWERFRRIIKAMYRNDTPQGGRPNTDDVVMVKLLVLQQWYGLSDPELERQSFDPLTSRIESLWSLYHKVGRDLEFVDDLEYRIHVYSASELTEVLSAAGWRVEEVLGSIVTGQRFSSQTSMNIVARAI